MSRKEKHLLRDTCKVKLAKCENVVKISKIIISEKAIKYMNVHWIVSNNIIIVKC